MEGVRLNCQKMRYGENGTSYYDNMRPEFLRDLCEMLGKPQDMEVHDGCYRFNLHGEEVVYFFTIKFDQRSGEYKGLDHVFTGRRKNGSPKISQKEKAYIIQKEITSAVLRFAVCASKLGYLTME